jgi:hypothetical protein
MAFLFSPTVQLASLKLYKNECIHWWKVFVEILAKDQGLNFVTAVVREKYRYR